LLKLKLKTDSAQLKCETKIQNWPENRKVPVRKSKALKNKFAALKEKLHLLTRPDLVIVDKTIPGGKRRVPYLKPAHEHPLFIRRRSPYREEEASTPSNVSDASDTGSHDSLSVNSLGTTTRMEAMNKRDEVLQLWRPSPTTLETLLQMPEYSEYSEYLDDDFMSTLHALFSDEDVPTERAPCSAEVPNTISNDFCTVSL
jgi:hypothetical protein